MTDAAAPHPPAIEVFGLSVVAARELRVGLTARFDSMQAAILLEKLSIFDDENLARDRIAARYTAGLNLIIFQGLRIKLSGEYWDFSDFSDEIGVHLGVVANF